MKVKILPINANFVMPQKAEGHEKDFCYDVTAVSEEEIAPNVWKYGLGFAAEIEPGDEYPHDCILDIDFRPRSSVWKTGMVLSNSVGTIDEIYRGEISAVFFHIMPNMPRYKVGDRIGQIKIGCTVSVEFEKVDRLSDTIRGAGGYGSTGK